MNLLWVNVFASYDGEDGGDNVPPAAQPPAAQPPASLPSGDGSTFTQEDLNRYMAEDRRKHQEKYKSLETSYQELLDNQHLTQEERDKLRRDYEDLQARHRTKEQQAAHERKLFEEAKEAELKNFRTAAETWEKRFTESTIRQALQDAAIEHDAYNASQIVELVRGKTELVELKDGQGKPTGELTPMVNMYVKNEETGVSEKLQMTPSEAVEYMKKTPETHGNLFKSNIREGIGSPNATGGGLTGPNGNVDHTRLTDEQWFKLRKENPAALGLDYKRR